MAPKHLIPWLLIAWLHCLELHGDFLVDNFGPNDSFSTSIGYGFGETQFGIVTEQGTAFEIPLSPSAGFRLNHIDASITHFSGLNVAYLDLYSDDNGLPGSILESSFVADFPDFDFLDPQITTFNFSGKTVLEPGETYYLIGRTAPTGSEVEFAWFQNDIGEQREIWSRFGQGAWIESFSTAPAFRVAATAIPEPTHYWILGILSATYCLRRKFHRIVNER